MMYILMICSTEKTEVMYLCYIAQLPMMVWPLCSITQPRQLGSTNILIHALLSRLPHVLISYQNDCFIQIISL